VSGILGVTTIKDELTGAWNVDGAPSTAFQEKALDGLAQPFVLNKAAKSKV